VGLTTPARLLCYLQDPDFPDFRRVQRNLMGTLVRIQPKGQMTIPRRVRSAVGLIDGDLLEVRAVGKRIVIVPQLVIDRSKFPNADDETEQRRIIKCPPGRSRKGTFSRPIQRRRRGCGFPQEENPEDRQGGQIKKIGVNVHLSQTAVSTHPCLFKKPSSSKSTIWSATLPEHAGVACVAGGGAKRVRGARFIHFRVASRNIWLHSLRGHLG
jgi:AbrB family looped-hinge helix DNA binding protein